MPKGKPKASIGLVREVARLASEHAKEIVQLVEVMQQQNSEGINSHLAKAGTKNAGMAVRNGLIARICVLVAAAYAPTQKRDKHLRVAYEILRDNSPIRDEIAKITSQKTVDEARSCWDKLLNDARRRRVKHFRDKATAHIAEPDLEIGDPTYKEFLDFALETATLMQLLSHAVGVAKEPINSFRDKFAAEANKFWTPWKDVNK